MLNLQKTLTKSNFFEKNHQKRKKIHWKCFLKFLDILINNLARGPGIFTAILTNLPSSDEITRFDVGCAAWGSGASEFLAVCATSK